jgi:hypothetical protein
VIGTTTCSLASLNDRAIRSREMVGYPGRRRSADCIDLEILKRRSMAPRACTDDWINIAAECRTDVEPDPTRLLGRGARAIRMEMSLHIASVGRVGSPREGAIEKLTSAARSRDSAGRDLMRDMPCPGGVMEGPFKSS